MKGKDIGGRKDAGEVSKDDIERKEDEMKEGRHVGELSKDGIEKDYAMKERERRWRNEQGWCRGRRTK